MRERTHASAHKAEKVAHQRPNKDNRRQDVDRGWWSPIGSPPHPPHQQCQPCEHQMMIGRWVRFGWLTKEKSGRTRPCVHMTSRWFATGMDSMPHEHAAVSNPLHPVRKWGAPGCRSWYQQVHLFACTIQRPWAHTLVVSPSQPQNLWSEKQWSYEGAILREPVGGLPAHLRTAHALLLEPTSPNQRANSPISKCYPKESSHALLLSLLFNDLVGVHDNMQTTTNR